MHRDLALRNLLVGLSGGDAQKYTIKVSGTYGHRFTMSFVFVNVPVFSRQCHVLVSPRLIFLCVCFLSSLYHFCTFSRLSDFGLSRVMSEDSNYYRPEGGAVVPFKWCSTEILQYSTYSSKVCLFSCSSLLSLLSHLFSPPPFLLTLHFSRVICGLLE